MATTGFLLGKFLPPHAGHVFLCDFARHYVDRLTILVCSIEREPIPGRLRHQWMSELFPDCRVVHCADEVPQDPSEHPDFWSIWTDIVRRSHPEPIDFVFASESYGQRLANEVQATFVPVDPGRQFAPVSGTQVRANPFGSWQHLPAPVRAHYAKTVCLFGPESTGKSTLAGRLVTTFDTVLVPEYGRTYTETFGVDCTADDLRNIVRGHRAATAAAKRQCNRIVVADTDPLMTAIWADMLLGSRPPDLDDVSELADLYLLADIDTPWVDDGTRYFPDPGTRQKFFSLCRQELERRRVPYVILSGDWETRFRTAQRAIHEHLLPDQAQG